MDVISIWMGVFCLFRNRGHCVCLDMADVLADDPPFASDRSRSQNAQNDPSSSIAGGETSDRLERKRRGVLHFMKLLLTAFISFVWVFSDFTRKTTLPSPVFNCTSARTVTHSLRTRRKKHDLLEDKSTKRNRVAKAHWCCHVILTDKLGKNSSPINSCFWGEHSK